MANLRECTIEPARAVWDKRGRLLGLLGDGDSVHDSMVRKSTIVMVSDSTGMDGFSEAGPQAFFTDSIAWWAAAYSKGALTIETSCAVGGWKTTDVDKYWDARVSQKRVRFPVLAVGLNDIYGATDGTVAKVEADLRAWYENKAREVIEWGGEPVIQTMFPCGNGYFAASAAKRKQAFIHNQWRREFAAENGLPLLDVESLVIDWTNANGDPYTAYFQPSGSPHPGKEMIRDAGEKLWTLLSSKVAKPALIEQANKFTASRLFTNPTLSGNGGNINGGNGASVLADSVWGWGTGAHTTYAVEASTDSKFSFAGAPVKSNWQKVTTNVGALATAPNGTPQSADRPGLMFFTSGLTLKKGDVVKATAEIEVITPNTMIGFSAALQDNTGTYGFTCPNQGSAFTPAVNADNSKNHILTPTVFSLPAIPVTIGEDLAGAGMWFMIQPTYSGVTGAAGNAVWRVRNVNIWVEPAL